MTEQDLWIASAQYMRGEISVEELKAIEKPYNDAFERALFLLAKRWKTSWVANSIDNMWRVAWPARRRSKLH